jgi:BirA family transcriptional regulator, biotin operon repressor / biotin---[acetyl-CoA-carboxylase] ligase
VFDVDNVRAALPGRRIDWFATLASTMIEARREPLPGRIVIADTQTAGMGRHGRTWHSNAGQGLYVSFVLEVAPVPVLTLALGLATAEAIGTPADLRWPNDVLLNGRKCAGILAQGEGTRVIAGIGINVSQTTFPDELATPSTSLALEGIAMSREALLIALTRAIDEHLQLSPKQILLGFEQASSMAYGQHVRVDEHTGVTCGLNESGFLRLRNDQGTETIILSGGVRPI